MLADSQLWTDWCQAAGIDPDRPDTASVERFLDFTCRSRSVRYRRRRTIQPHTASRSVGTVFDPAPKLALLDRFGWPAGLNRSRDAFIVAAFSRGLTRRQIRELQPSQIETASGTVLVAGRAVPEDMDRRRCAACAVTDWLEIVSSALAGGRGETQQILTGAGATEHHHRLTDTRWKTSHILLPPIDRHGWIDTTRTMSLRSITAALGPRPAAPPHQIVVNRPVPRHHASTDALLDIIEAEADAAYREVANLMRRLGLTPQ